MYVPIFLLLSALFVLVDASGLDWLMALVAVWVVVVSASSLGVGGRAVDRSRTGPSGVRQAQAACRPHPGAGAGSALV